MIRKAEVLEEELQTVREEATHNNEDLQTKLQALSRYVNSGLRGGSLGFEYVGGDFPYA